MSDIDTARERYSEMTGKDVPARFKNDIDWLNSKVIDVEQENANMEKDRGERMDKKADEKGEEWRKYKQRLYNLEKGIATKCDDTKREINSPSYARCIPSECKIVYHSSESE